MSGGQCIKTKKNPQNYFCMCLACMIFSEAVEQKTRVTADVNAT